MKRTIFCRVIVALMVGLPALPVHAADQASPAAAQVMAERAASFLRLHRADPQSAYDAFNSGAQWHDRELYVFVVSADGTMRAHGTMPALIGKATPDMRDVDGKVITREIWACAAPCWVDYKWKNPVTGKVVGKLAYVVAVGDVRVVVGAYKP